MRREPRAMLISHVLVKDHHQDKTIEGLASNLSLSGIFVKTSYSLPIGSGVLLEFALPGNQSPTNGVMARVVRVDEKGFAAEFMGIDTSALAHFWSYIGGHLLREKRCPYCGRTFPQAKRPEKCPHCGHSLTFEDPQYLEKREVTLHRKFLFDMIGTLSDSDTREVFDFVVKLIPDRKEGMRVREYNEEMIGTCPEMKEVFHLIRKLALTDTPVIITGASGTGKEMAARAVHERSPRKNGPFVVINCGAIPQELLESELFGHEKGAFTGAYRQVKGKIECVSGGTLFLDEISELPLALQVKLLRFLQDHTIERVGGRQSIKVDLRVIAATNIDLKKAVTQGRFREDLYYRLDVVNIFMPPLSQRGDDIIIMAQVFLERYARQLGRKVHGFTKDATVALKAHSWPGNVRELINRIRRGVVMSEGNWITPNNLGLAHLAGFPSSQNVLSLKDAKAQFESSFIQKVLQIHQGRITYAAKALKISRSNLYYLIRRYKINTPAR